MKKLLFLTPGQADVILTKPVARLVVFSSSRGPAVKSLDPRNKTPKLDIFFSVRSVDSVKNERTAELSVDCIVPRFRQRVASMAGLIFDLDHADWPAVSNAWEKIRQETKGTALEKSVESLRDPIRRKHAHALAQTIDALLRDN